MTPLPGGPDPLEVLTESLNAAQEAVDGDNPFLGSQLNRLGWGLPAARTALGQLEEVVKAAGDVLGAATPFASAWEMNHDEDGEELWTALERSMAPFDTSEEI